MKTLFVILLIGSLSATSCSKNEKQENVAPADYAETTQKLIQNPAKDSAHTDSSAVPTAIPAQNTVEKK